MIWNQVENSVGETLFVTEYQGEEFVVAQLKGWDCWWLIPSDPMKMRSLVDNATEALHMAKKYITATN